MQGQDWPAVRDLVLIGGGHAHALVMDMWAMDPLPGVRLTLVNPGPVAPYTGMLPGHIAGHYARHELMIDLVRLARHTGARLVIDRAIGLDRTARRVLLAGGRAISETGNKCERAGGGSLARDAVAAPRPMATASTSRRTG